MLVSNELNRLICFSSLFILLTLRTGEASQFQRRMRDLAERYFRPGSISDSPWVLIAGMPLYVAGDILKALATGKDHSSTTSQTSC